MSKRLEEEVFQDQSFGCSAGKLFCHGCMHQVSVVRDSLWKHMKAETHELRLVAYNKASEVQLTILDALNDADKAGVAPGFATSQFVSERSRIFRVKYVENFAANCIPLQV